LVRKNIDNLVVGEHNFIRVVDKLIN